MVEVIRARLDEPLRDHIIERPRLIALLEEADARTALFVAPAGYGKTTLARQWSKRQTAPVAWYRTTRASGDVAALAVALDTLLDRVVPQPRRDPHRVAAIAAVNARPQPLARALLSTYASLPSELLLVLDEWEAADTDEADQLVARLLDGLDIRVLVTSRTRPPWFTSRSSIYGSALELGMETLAMTDEEALAVLSVDGSPENPEPLLATARGWPAVLGLAAMRGASAPPPVSLPASTLYDYLASELLDSAPDEVREGLTRLAAASVTDVEAAELLLADRTEPILAAARRLSLVRIDEDGALSLHPLLRDLLLGRLVHLRPAEIEELVDTMRPLLPASRWDEALSVAEVAPERSFVTDALAQALDDLLRAGRVATLRRWVAAGRRAGAASGLVDYAESEVAYRDAEFERAIALAVLATQALRGDMAAKAHLVAARAANLADRLEHTRRHLVLAEDLAEEQATRAAALWGRFIHAVDEQQTNARELLYTFERTSPPGPEQLIRVAHGQLRMALLEGDLGHHLDDAEIVAPLLTSDADPMVRSSFLNILSTACSIAGCYAEALAAAKQERAIADEFEFEFVVRHALVNQARALIGLREIANAERALLRIERKLQKGEDIFLSVSTVIERARLYVTVGDLERAEACLCLPPPERLNNGTKATYDALHALIYAASAERSAAVETAQRALATSSLLEVRHLAAVADCIAHLNDSRGAERSTSVFTQAVREGTCEAIVMGCRASTAFASTLARDASVQPVLAAILRRSNDAALGKHLGLAVPRSVTRGRGLSAREREIHALIAQGLTNPEISALLYIAESTTKRHVRHILEKLGVRSRVEAARLWQDEGPPA